MGATTAPKGDFVPIEGLGFGIQSTTVLRGAGITSIGKLRDVLGGNEEGLRILGGHEDHREFLRSAFVREELRAQLAVFDRSGPVAFASLSRLETEVRDLVVTGQLNKAISVQLGIHENIIEAQLMNIYRKMKGPCAPYAA